MQKHNNKVSVIIPVLNDQTGINLCLSALAKQTFPLDLYEVIVVDNGSIPPIELDPVLCPNGQIITCASPGAYAARNAGISAARGEVFAFTDADCVPDSDWINSGLTALSGEGGRCFIGGEVVMPLPKNANSVELYQCLTGFLQRENAERLEFTATANLFVYKWQMDLIGSFDERLLSAGDREWSWRAAQVGFHVKYASEVKVMTSPRKNLTSAIRQTRRVAGGRFFLRRSRCAHITPAGLNPHRSMGNAVLWILFYPKLSIYDKIRVFFIASLLKIVHSLETIRLSFGFSPERR